MKFTDEPDPQAFAERLRALADQRGLTQSRLAEIAEVSQPTVHRWLNGTLPMPSMVQFLATRLDVGWRWLVYGEPSDAFPRLAEEPSAPREDPVIERLRYILGQASPDLIAVVRRVIDEAHDQTRAARPPLRYSSQSQSQSQSHK